MVGCERSAARRPPLIWAVGVPAAPRCRPARWWGAAAGWAVRSSGERHGAPVRRRRRGPCCRSADPLRFSVARWRPAHLRRRAARSAAGRRGPQRIAPYMRQLAPRRAILRHICSRPRPLVKSSPDFARYMAHFPASPRQWWRIRSSQLAPCGDNDSPHLASLRAIIRHRVRIWRQTRDIRRHSLATWRESHCPRQRGQPTGMREFLRRLLLRAAPALRKITSHGE